ncbi:tail fiber domain-containing protein [Corallococcus exercitus]|uniref:tail fiber domain-containing protein n=1 Tax=Corallococcus exercitus TaxID=2316736 RepID=UPI001315A3BB|nr:tail fiber domain-containing protein [Corallococcus exercitus]
MAPAPPNKSLERTFYFEGELLQLGDFVRDQQYVRDLVAYQNRFLFAPGVVQGLTLSGQNTSMLAVGPGVAFNANGVPLYVVQSTNMSVQGQTADGTYQAILDYGDNKTADQQSSLKTTHAIIENPRLTLAQNYPGPGIILGTAVFAGGKITSIDSSAASGRQQSWLTLPTTQPAAPKNDATTPTAMLSVGAGDAQPQAFSGPLSVGPGPASTDAMLSVTQAMDGLPAGTSTARFDFTDGTVKDSGVRLNLKRADGSHALLSARFAGSDVWELDQDGTPRTLSDASLKVDVRPLTGVLERVAALRPVSFAWRADPSGPRRLGLLAQETARVLPEVVGTNAQGQATISYQELVPLLLQCVRELTERVAGLEKRLEAGDRER